MIRSKLHSLFFLESGRVLRQLIEDSGAGVYIADTDGNIIYVNASFANMLGYPLKDHLVGMSLSKDLYASLKEYGDFYQAMAKFGFVRDYEVRNKCKDGSLAVLSVTGNWIRDEASRVIGIECIAHDITEKKKAEEAFRREKEVLGLIMDFEEQLNSKHDAQQVGRFAVEETAGLFKAQICSLMLLDEKKQELYIQAAKGLNEEIINNVHMKTGEDVAGTVAQKHQPILVANIDYELPLHRPRRYITRSFMSVPVFAGTRFLGVFNLTDKMTEGVFTPLDLKMFCVIGRVTGIALENAAMFQHLEKLAFTPRFPFLF